MAVWSINDNKKARKFVSLLIFTELLTAELGHYDFFVTAIHGSQAVYIVYEV